MGLDLQFGVEVWKANVYQLFSGGIVLFFARTVFGKVWWSPEKLTEGERGQVCFCSPVCCTLSTLCSVRSTHCILCNPGGGVGAAYPSLCTVLRVCCCFCSFGAVFLPPFGSRALVAESAGALEVDNKKVLRTSSFLVLVGLRLGTGGQG